MLQVVFHLKSQLRLDLLDFTVIFNLSMLSLNLALKGVNRVEVFSLIKERLPLLSVFLITIIASLFWLVIVWKRKESLPKFLSVMLIIISLFLIGASLYGMIFFLSFGYNS